MLLVACLIGACAQDPAGVPTGSRPDGSDAAQADIPSTGGAQLDAAPAQPGDPASSTTGGSATDGSADAVPSGDPDTDASVDLATIEVSTEQVFVDLRPEFLDYLWNNLDPELFQKWHPTAHTELSWTRPPNVPGDLGAEVAAEYTSSLTLADASHALRTVYVDPLQPANAVALESAMAADVWIDDVGPFRLVVEYEQQGDEVRIKQRHAVPADADEAAWRGYLEERMTYLAEFIRDDFQSQYVEAELTPRGTVQVIDTGLSLDLTQGLATTDVVVTQDIGKLTPDMVDWWWDNMGETERYRHWHPTAHQSFVWTIPPTNPNDLMYDAGSMQQIVEVIGESSTLNIGWLDPAQVPIEITHSRYIYGSTNLEGTPFGGYLVHEYDARPDGGITMKSTFRVPTLAGADFPQLLGEHCVQEMQFLQYYLPKLFAQQYMP